MLHHRKRLELVSVSGVTDYGGGSNGPACGAPRDGSERAREQRAMRTS